MSLTGLMGLYLESTGSDMTFNCNNKIAHTASVTGYSLVLVLLVLDCLTFQTMVLLSSPYQHHLLLYL